MRNELYNFLNDFNNVYFDGGYKSFPVDVVEVNDGYQVICEMPGVLKENISASFNDGILSIRGKYDKEVLNKNKEKKYLIHERNYQKLKRDINFGDIKVCDLAAKFENGLLTITIKTEQEESKPKMITIE